MLTTHPLLVPRLRKSRSYTSCHPNAPLWSVTGPLYFFTCKFTKLCIFSPEDADDMLLRNVGICLHTHSVTIWNNAVRKSNFTHVKSVYGLEGRRDVGRPRKLRKVRNDCLIGCCSMQSGRSSLQVQICSLPPLSKRACPQEASKEGRCTSETSVNYQLTWRNNPEDRHFHSRRGKNLKCHRRRVHFVFETE
jgi:hypothetical protein